jgi:hypothetical protein
MVEYQKGGLPIVQQKKFAFDLNMTLSIALFCLLFVSCGHAFANSSVPTVTTLNGTYAGRHLQTWEQDIFLGIPYAKPPVGALRFKWPQSIDTSFDGVRDASTYGYSCYQYNSDFNLSEDCLTLNGDYPPTQSVIYRLTSQSSGQVASTPPNCPS